MHLKRKKRFKTFSQIDRIIFLVCFIFLILDFISSFNGDKNLFIQLQFLLLEILCLGFYAYDKKPYSIHKFILLYLLIFAGFAPLKQYINNSNLWGVALNTDAEWAYANFIVVIFLFTLEISYWILFKNVKIHHVTLHSASTRVINVKHKEEYVLKGKSMLLLSILEILSIVYMGTHRMIITLNRNGNFSVGTADTITIFLNYILRSFCVACLILYILKDRKGYILASKNERNIFKAITFFSVAIVFFPFWGSIPRFLLFAVYIMILILIFPNLQLKSLLLLLTIFGFDFIFPAFNFFKYNGFSNISEFALYNANFDHYDFDAHQLLIATIQFVENNGLLWGMNILSAIFCFIPRSIWKSKCIPTGNAIFRYANASFDNVSCPIYAEFYAAFGLIGVILLTVIFVYVIRYIEKGYSSNNTYIKGTCIIVMGMIIYIMRGAMLPTFSYTLAILLSFSISYLIGKMVN
ncbi:MAG: O-antigen ligase [Stecheria intestinalis]|nr:O-antigen ligase [Stecheria intestinalis]